MRLRSPESRGTALLLMFVHLFDGHLILVSVVVRHQLVKRTRFVIVAHLHDVGSLDQPLLQGAQALLSYEEGLIPG